MYRLLCVLIICTMTFTLSGCIVYQRETYVVTFDAKGGNTPNVQYVERGKTASMPSSTLEGYTIEGWYTSLDGGLTLDKKWSFASSFVNSNLTLYANWTINQYTIIFYSDEVIDIDPIIQDYDSKIVLPTLSKEGYVFLGWFEDDEYNKEFTLTTMPSKDLTLFAKWEINQYTVNFESNGGTPVDSISQDYNSIIEKPSDPTREGYTFDGWFLDEDLTEPFSFECFPDKSITLYAKWLFNKDNTLLIGEKGVTYTIPTGADDSGTAQVSGGFLMAKTETSYELWYEVRVWAEDNGYFFQNIGREGHDGIIGAEPTDDRFEPVTTVSWRDCIVWCNAYSEYISLDPVYRSPSGEIIKDSRDENAQGLDSAVQADYNGYRLPTSLEWEMAARWRTTGGEGSILIENRFWTIGNHASGAKAYHNNYNETTLVTWFKSNSGDGTHQVAIKKGNELGLFDMSGNVWEWCFDWHPIYVVTNRIIRGGSYDSFSSDTQVGHFGDDNPYRTSQNYGFRIVRNENDLN